MTNKSSSKSKVNFGFTVRAVPNAVATIERSYRQWTSRATVMFTVVSLLVSVFTPTNVTRADHDDPFGGVLQTKVKICHSGNGKNFVSNEPSISGTGANPSFEGHLNHSSDIIPPFHYAGGVYAGSSNWNDTTEAIWNNGECDGIGDKNTGNVKIVKIANGGNGTFDFVTTGDGFTIGSITTVNGTGSVTVTGLKKNEKLTINESVEPGWTQTNAVCDNAQTISDIKVIDGKTITCTFTNTKDVVIDPCLEIPTSPDCLPATVDVKIQKVWQNAAGQEIDPPSSKGDITITVDSGIAAEQDCKYENDNFDCVIETSVGSTIVVEESGLPAGWVVDPATVGSQIVPDCNVNLEDADCVHTVVNKLKTPVRCGLDLVLNGDFEAPEVTNNAQWDIFPSGSAGMGWSAEWVNPTPGEDPAKMELHEGVLGADHSASGDQYTELDSDFGGPDNNTVTGENASVKLYQDLITHPGGNYTVKFWTSPRPDQPAADNQIRLQVGGINEVVNDTAGGISWTEHTYNFVATGSVTRITFSDAGTGNSFGGFLDDVSVVEDCISDVTICKYDNHQNPLAGWEVFLKGSIADTVTVQPDGSNDISATLSAGEYVLEASGTYVYRPSDPAASISDAAYSKRLPTDSVYSIGDDQPWVRVNDFPGSVSGYLGIQVDEANFNWGTDFNASNEYAGFKTLSTDGQIKFRILDDNYSDNSGSLTVKIYPVIKGITGVNGCVTLNDVDFDTYTLGELMKDGWSNVSGKDTSAVVDSVTEQFNLVNKCDEGCESQVTVCKEDDQGNGLAGWTVFLKGPMLETVSIAANNPNGSNSTNALVSGQSYIVEASGEWQNRGFETVDASFTTPDGWDTELAAPQGGFPDDLLELQVNNGFVNWGPYNEDHEYSYLMTGNGATANFRVFDGDANTNTLNPGWYGDNVDLEDGLVVDIFPVYSGVTGDNGCVTLEDVAYGSYKLGEIMQDGWSNEEGNGDSVTVDEPTEGLNSEDNQFTLVNICDSRECAQPIPTLHLIKVVCDEFNDIAGNEQADENDETDDENYEDFSNYLGSSPHFPAFTGFVHPDEIPVDSGCSRADGWEFVLSTDQGQDSNVSTKVTVNGEYSTAISGLGSDLSAELQAGIRTGNFWVSEVEKDDYDFGQLRCYNDALYGDNLEFINIGDTNPANIYCIAYNVPEDDNGGGNGDNGGQVGGDVDYSISGKVYDDSDKNYDRNGGELGLPGWTVNLYEYDSADEEGVPGDLIDNKLTDGVGDYLFEDLDEGCYVVEEVVKSGWVQTEPGELDSNDYLYYVALGDDECGFPQAEGDAVGLEFGNFLADQGGCVVNCGNTNNRSSSGSRVLGDTNPGLRVPQILGDSTTIPSDSPTTTTEGQVAGASTTTLPRTGMPTWAILMIVILAAVPALGMKGLSFKKTE